ncbi:MAG: hypothetical protein CM1200mP16_11930 [Nitrospina sp.]|nr:MAG: hypothetical protein CM1200mP16_11930 [Nitrospina sp.]
MKNNLCKQTYGLLLGLGAMFIALGENRSFSGSFCLHGRDWVEFWSVDTFHLILEKGYAQGAIAGILTGLGHTFGKSQVFRFLIYELVRLFCFPVFLFIL